MFGYVTTNSKSLSESDKKRYGRIYCGVCHALTEHHGKAAKFTLNYDITFLALLLSLIYENEEIAKSGRCISSPIKKKEYFFGDIYSYCADMNIILSYYNLLDDVSDDGSIGAKVGAKLLENSFTRAKTSHSEKAKRIEFSMEKLSELEKNGESNADTVADVFGDILGEIFSYGEYGKKLYLLGKALGKFIYILDACVDIHADLKKGRYNPLTFSLNTDYDMMLASLMADVEAKLKEFPDLYSDTIVKNIIYSGIWTEYEKAKARRK